MRRFAIFALALALTGAAACDDDSNGPSSTPIVFTVDLAASNEVPAVSNAESGATGRATITFSVPIDGSGNPTDGGTWNVQAIVTGFTPDSRVQAAHIHNGPVGQNAQVFVNTGLTTANAIPVNVSATINFEGRPNQSGSGAGRHRQPGRPLLQHAHPAQRRRRGQGPAGALAVAAFDRPARRRPGAYAPGSLRFPALGPRLSRTGA